MTLLCKLERMLECTYGFLKQVLIIITMGSMQSKGFLNCSDCSANFYIKRCLNLSINIQNFEDKDAFV